MTIPTRPARLAGLSYLGLAVSGMLAYLVIRQQLYVPDDAVATTANLVEQTTLARLGIAMDLTVVLTQALAAVWFFMLFRGVSSFAAGAIAAFGLVNAVLILVATAFTATALDVALSDGSRGVDGPAATQLLYELSGTTWDLGGLFFGLWLIPMGWCAMRSGFVPRALGRVLVAGGIGYVLGTYVAHAPGLSGASFALTVPAAVGEMWMVGYLLWKGLRRATPVPADRAVRVPTHG
ncbi:DUF4386 domain-containing protein [Actinotalea sp. K2]|uniref:DUF4386 domain-containing protein n=1 Tax=Actinotalea sp. K2 TaxID=2939438 RepID=UPI002017E9E3|nr:DUF4386 domain-containing protein [Actinotalea sp. K2]MCL3860633.1 DUF4386 domain-containing protein [Actinotalea sp. K2]